MAPSRRVLVLFLMLGLAVIDTHPFRGQATKPVMMYSAVIWSASGFYLYSAQSRSANVVPDPLKVIKLLPYRTNTHG